MKMVQELQHELQKDGHVNRYRDLLGLYVSGMVDEQIATVIAEHIPTCPGCRNTTERLRHAHQERQRIERAQRVREKMVASLQRTKFLTAQVAAIRLKRSP